MRCEAEPVAALVLRYERREVLIERIAPTPDPSAVELCREHAAKVTPPIGWAIRERRPEPVG
jgi:hypothetical protein